MRRQMKYQVIQLGCASNEADSFGIKSCLLGHGFTISDTVEDSDVIIVMTCGFSSKQYHDSLECIQNVNRTKRADAEIWIGGCIPAINKNLAKELPFEVSLFFARALSNRNWKSICKPSWISRRSSWEMKRSSPFLSGLSTGAPNIAPIA